jgi:hypothetical protein
MWKIDDLGWGKYLAYNLICCFIQYHELHGYGILELTMKYLGVYALHYYIRLEVKYVDLVVKDLVAMWGHYNSLKNNNVMKRIKAEQ